MPDNLAGMFIALRFPNNDVSLAFNRFIQVCCGLLFLLSTVGAQNSMPFLLTADIDSLNCHGDSNGAITFSIGGGVPPYHYQWRTTTNPFVFATGILEASSTSGVINNLPASYYVIYISDAVGGEYRDTIVLPDPPPLYLTDATILDSRCANTCDGSILLQATGAQVSLPLGGSIPPAPVCHVQDFVAESISFVYKMKKDVCKKD
ncbi:MAG: SprB repeat-containing protein [Saprospiraceae bacterium]